MRVYQNVFQEVISIENLFRAGDEFKRGKRWKKDVMEFEINLESNLFQLHRDLSVQSYRHGPYTAFYINDPKQRHIHKATVRDRVVHHAIFSVLNPIFEPTFIPASFSCRVGKGTHKGVRVLAGMLRQVSRNNTKQCFALKCDINKFFASIDHDILLSILHRRIDDDQALWLLKEVIGSFVSDTSNIFYRTGLPIGNLTSQLFANVYLHELDQFVQRDMTIKSYVRYTDDFVILANTQATLQELLPNVQRFLKERLRLELHPKKVSIRKYSQGIDFLGYVILPNHIVIRTKTKQRILRRLRQRIDEYERGRISEHSVDQTLQSYRGVLSHANSYRLRQEIENQAWFWKTDQ